MRSSIPLFALVAAIAATALLVSFAGSTTPGVTITQFTTSTTPQGDQNPCWCPDGSQIGYENRDADPSNPSIDYSTYPAGMEYPMTAAGRTGVDYAPNLTDVAYSKLDGTWTHIYIMPMGMPEMALTTGTAGPNYAGFYGDVEPAFSPDNNWVVFESSRGDLVYGQNDVWVINMNGTGLKKIASGPGDQMWPTWEPSGNGVVYTNSSNELMHVALVGANTWGTPTDLGVMGHHPRFSHDGKFLAFDRGGDIWVMNYATKAQANLTNDGNTVPDSSPTWGPTNDSIAFSSTGRAGNANQAIYLASGVQSLLATPTQQVTLGFVKAKYRQ
jgi:Tol biopolymer transport system component